MLGLISIFLYAFLYDIQNIQVNGKTEYSNEWLAEIQANENDVKIIVKRHGFGHFSKIGDDMFVLVHANTPRSSRARAEKVRKLILKEKQVVFVEQQKWNKWVHRSVSVNDPYWRNMWYLNENVSPDMGVLSSWSKGYTGDGVTIAVVDDGVEINHPDLNANIDLGLSADFYDRDKDPTPAPGKQHGTECAGITVAAANNTNCVIGVAFKSKLAGLRIEGPLGSTSTAEREALLAANIDIYLNSWGVMEKTTIEGPSSIVKSALRQGTQQGRNGLGSIYVWAAGNGGSDDNCNCDGFVNSIYTIAISSVSAKLQPPGYAEPCAAIMASTYSGGGGSSNNICTTSLNSTCVTSFTGTSAATPIAAGIFALVLQANPILTWRDIQHLIVNTSDLTGLKYGKSKVNGASITVSDYFGFGLLKSDILIDRALSWEMVSEQHICLSYPKKPFNKPKILPRDPQRTVSSSLHTNGCKKNKNEVKTLEHVEVDVTYSYTLRGAVQFFLISPSGTKSQLLTRRNYDVKRNSTQQWTFMSLHFWNEDPEGTWTLQMSLNMDYAELGQLSEWSLRMYGTTINTYDNTETEKTDLIKILVTIFVIAFVIVAAGCLILCCKKYNNKVCADKQQETETDEENSTNDQKTAKNKTLLHLSLVLSRSCIKCKQFNEFIFSKRNKSSNVD